MTDHIVGINKKVLSPGAQAVLDAVFDHWPGGYNHPGKPLCVAAALRAVAGQMEFVQDYRKLHAIATELESQ